MASSSKSQTIEEASGSNVPKGNEIKSEENPDCSLTTYVHQLSPVKRNRKNTKDNSTLLLQTNDETVEALLYSKHKRPLLQDSANCRTPAKIQRFTCTADGEKVIINDMTKISVPDHSEYSFQFVETNGSTKILSIKEILECGKEWDNVAVKLSMLPKVP